MADNSTKITKDKLLRFLESDYYNMILKAWLKAYARVGGNPNMVIKKYILEEGGLINHQRLDHYFPTIEDIYKMTRTRFALQMKDVMYGYLHQNATGSVFWTNYLMAVRNCKKECMIAIRRKDYLFFRASLNRLQPALEQSVFECAGNELVYRRCYAALLGILYSIVEEWDQNNYAAGDLNRYAREIAQLSYSFNHSTATFDYILR